MLPDSYSSYSTTPPHPFFITYAVCLLAGNGRTGVRGILKALLILRHTHALRNDGMGIRRPPRSGVPDCLDHRRYHAHPVADEAEQEVASATQKPSIRGGFLRGKRRPKMLD